MHQFVQSAIEAANQGDKTRAMSFIKEVLSANPNDVDAWLVLAAIVDEPQRKRQCLNRVLALDPVNQIARDELFEMDRADLGHTPPFMPEDDPVSQTLSQPEPQPIKTPEPHRAGPVSPSNWSEEIPKAAPQRPQGKPSAKSAVEKPLVFRYSIVTQIIIYVFSALLLCSFLLVLQDPNLIIIPCGFSLIALPAIWIVSSQVMVSGKGIATSRLFGLIPGAQVAWGEIARIKSNAMKQNLELITKQGKSVKITSQVSGYPQIVETLRQKRPDLFGMAQPSASRGGTVNTGYEESSTMGYAASSMAPSFSGTRTFKKSFFKQYGSLIFVIPLGLYAAWTAFDSPQNRLVAGITAVVCFIFVLLPFLQVGSVKVEPNKLTVETFIEQKEFSARDIRDIKMQSVRGRYGRVTNFVNIVTAQGKNYPLQGFSDGDEIIYGFLHQWWEAYRNR